MKLGARLMALSFISLFLELMMIRWVPAVVRVVAYYANLMLISSFLGLGIGAILAERNRRLIRWLPILLIADVALLLVCRHMLAPGSGAEWRFAPEHSQMLGYVVLIAIFAANTVVFIPLGEQIGQVFRQLPPLRAYSWDLGGSLLGTISFGLFSITHFSPVIGMAIVAVILIALVTPKERWLAGLVLGCVVATMYFSADRAARWSPYYYVTMHQVGAEGRPVGDPPPNLRTMRDPPIYNVQVNHDFYQRDWTIDLSRYTRGEFRSREVEPQVEWYPLPFVIAKNHDEVVVLGSGGGPDVEAALLAGAKHVDAVDIDPMLIRLSRKYAASGVYDDPRVSVHTDDARAFLRNTRSRYDMVIYGYLDSLALFSYGSSLRLDGFTYTVESFRRAWDLCRDDGVVVLSFYAGRPWLMVKLMEMMRAATGMQPLAYLKGERLLIMAPKGQTHPPPRAFAGFERIEYNRTAIDLASDDWPYLYLVQKTIPADYLIVIGTLLAGSIAGLLAIRGRGFAANDAHFMFLGLGFLLLQTKSIGDCSLYFGTTWLVTTIVITGVLAMVLAANLLAMRMRQFSPWLYAPLLASLALLIVVPRDRVLAQPYALRLAWSLVAVPLPVFFAGLIFSTTFRGGRDTAALFGANLIGATIGGFCEYLGMAFGTSALAYLIVAAYLASLVCQTASIKTKQLAASLPLD